jgi:AraC family transcriptional regulator
MLPEIILMPTKRIVGKNMKMSLLENKTAELWRSFMIRRNEVFNRIGEEYYSVNVYATDFHISQMNMETEFVKWAGVEVSSNDDVPVEMESYEIPEGQYAVFIHKGGMEAFGATMNHIFSEWLPTSEFEWDNRPQIEVLGKKYKNNSDDSEEAVWIPIRKK